MKHEHIDETSGVSTTGHEWDGIRELNNPLPRWWLWTFYATIVWGLAYTVAYPAWPLISQATGGLLGYSSRAELSDALARVESERAAYAEIVGSTDLQAIIDNEDLRRFAAAAGEAAFKVNCVQCHGSGAQGAAGYPNLNDDDWLWGGSLEAISHTIAHGVRSDADPDSRMSQMPAFGDILARDQTFAVVEFVLEISGHDGLSSERVAAGEAVYEQNCAACHGANGKGDTSLGAPDLTDAIWLYGDSREAIASQIRNPSHGMMPPWQDRLGETVVKELTVYIHSLGGTTASQ